MNEEITNGELHRTLLQIKTDHGLQLSAIFAEQKLTNGRVRRNEVAIAVLQVGYVLGSFVLGAVFLWVVNNWGKW
jgi:hypothetical protein